MTPTRSCSVYIRISPWITAILGFTFTLWAFYPGYMSYDSADQWFQARHNAFNTLHPPAMAMLWQLTDHILPGPGGMLIVQSLLHWVSLAILMSAMPFGIIGRIFSIIAIGFWPPIFGLLPHIWKDVFMMSAFGWATTFLFLEIKRPSRWLRIAAVVVISFACMMRHNAILGVLPFALWIGIRELSARSGMSWYRIWLTFLTLMITGSIYVLSILPNYAHGVRRIEDLWSLVALWDIAGVSLRNDKLLFPEIFYDPSLSLKDIERNFMETANSPLFNEKKLKHNLVKPFTTTERQALLQAWLSIMTDHTKDYLAHRLRLAQLLFGWDQSNHPNYLVFHPGIYAMPDNPPVLANDSKINQVIQSGLNAIIDTPLFAGWWYILVLLAIGVISLTRLQYPSAGLATVVTTSALVYSLPLVLISGSADFRYLSWLVLATPIAALLLISCSFNAPGDSVHQPPRYRQFPMS